MIIPHYNCFLDWVFSSSSPLVWWLIFMCLIVPACRKWWVYICLMTAHFLLPIKPLFQRRVELIAPLPISSRPQTKTTAHLVAEVYWKLPFLLMQSVYLITWQGWPEGNTRQMLLEEWLLMVGRWGPCLQDLACCGPDWTSTSADLEWVRSIWEYWLVLSIMKKQKLIWVFCMPTGSWEKE